MEQQNSTNKEIFSFIQNLLVTHEFRQAQIDYFEKHSKDFDKIEENKHEQHDLFRQYTEILDSTIDKKLLEKFSQSQIKAFYEDFEENHKKYDIKSNFVGTIDLLFSFTDYQVFKQTMLDYYERNFKGKTEKATYNKLEGDFSQEKFNSLYEKDISQWHKVLIGSQEGQVNIYTLPFTEKCSIVRTSLLFKGVTEKVFVDTIVNVDLDKLKVAVPIYDELYYAKKESNGDKIIYAKYQLPMMPMRESIIKVGTTKYKDITVIKQNAVELPEFPLRDDCVRLEQQKQIYIKQLPGTKDTLFTEINFVDQEFGVPRIFLDMMVAKTTKQGTEQFYQMCLAQQQAADKQ